MAFSKPRKPKPTLTARIRNAINSGATKKGMHPLCWKCKGTGVNRHTGTKCGECWGEKYE